MTTSPFARFVAAGLAIALLVAGFAGVVPAQAATQTLTLALVTSSAEDDTEASRQMAQGVQVGIEVLNALGGVRDPDGKTTYNFTLKQRTASTQTEMRSAIQASVDDKPTGIIGPNAVALANNNLDLATSARIPQLVNLPDDPAGSIGNFIFRMRASDEALARDLANYLVTHRYVASIATATDNSQRGRDDVAAFDRAARSAGVTPNPALTFDSTATDLSGQAQDLTDADAEAVVIFGEPDTAAILVRELRARDYDGVIAYGSLSGNEAEFRQNAGDSAAGVVAPLLWSPDAIDAGSSRFAVEYQKRFGERPDANAVIGFDSVAAIAAAIEVAGKDPVEIRDTLATVGPLGGVQGVYSPASFPNGGRTIEASVIVALEADGISREQARFNIGLCLRNCAETRWPDNSGATTNTARSVTLGFVAPQTGPDGEIGRRALQGAQLAVNEINTAGGIIGPQNTRYTLDLRSYDATSAEATAQAMRAALTTQPVALLGPTLTGLLVPNLGVAPAARVPQLVSGTSVTLTGSDPSRFVLQLRPADAVWATSLASYLVDIRGYTRLATAAATTSYGQDSVAAFNAVVNRYASVSGARVVAATSHSVTATDLSMDVQTILAANPQVVAVWTAPGPAAALLKGLRAAGYTGVFAYGAISNPDFLAALTTEELNGVIGTANWTPAAVDAASQQFVENYQRTFGELPDMHSVAYYDAVYLVAQGIRATGPAALTTQQFIIRLPRFVGVQGEYRPAINNNGQLGATVLILQAGADGALSELSRFDNGICVNSCY